MKKPIFRDNRGLTLIEMVIGVSIMAIVVVPLLHSFVSSANTAKKSALYTSATAAAQNIIEMVEAADIDDYISDITENSENSIEYNDDTRTYRIIQRNIKSGSSSFDALITLSPANASNSTNNVNNTKAAIGNPMDALIDMNAADSMALNELYAQLDGLPSVSPELTLENLKRTITITAKKDENKDNTYSIEVVFNYRGRFTYLDEENKPVSIGFDHDVKGRAAANSANSFSLYLFFKASYANNDSIIINNPDYQNKDFKVFLVNTNESIPSASYKADIKYYYQTNKEKALVFTNIDTNTYKAFSTDSIWFEPVTMTGALVEQKTLDRLYIINVQIFESGKGFETPIANMRSDKLN